MIQPGEAGRTVRSFFDAYLIRRNVKDTLDFVTDTVHWVGTGKSELSKGRDQTEQALLTEFSQAPEPMKIEYDSFDETVVSDRCAVVLLTADVYPPGSEEPGIWFRVSAACVKEEDGICRIASIHASTPERQQEEGGYFPKSMLDRYELERERQVNQYDHLFQSVLCGIVQYRLTGMGVEFKNANREAIRIFGYEPEEFWQKEDWDLPMLIMEEDRETVLKEIDTLHETGDKSDFEYRLLQKDGIPCWIIGSAEVLLDSAGEQIIQSVFIDINARKRAELNELRLTRQVEASNEIIHLALEHTTVGAGMKICRTVLQRNRWMKRIIQPSMRCTIRFTAENGRLPANSAERTAVIGAARPCL